MGRTLAFVLVAIVLAGCDPGWKYKPQNSKDVDNGTRR